MNRHGFNKSQSGCNLAESSDYEFCCLTYNGVRCTKKPGNVTYNKQVADIADLNLCLDPAAMHIYICNYHKIMIQNAKALKPASQEEHPPTVDLSQLHINSLKRYKNHFNIETEPGLNKVQMSEVLLQHFKTIPVNENEVISRFINKVKGHTNESDENSSE